MLHIVNGYNKNCKEKEFEKSSRDVTINRNFKLGVISLSSISFSTYNGYGCEDCLSNPVTVLKKSSYICTEVVIITIYLNWIK